MLRKLSLSRFRKDQSGNLSIEACLMLPLLAWIYVASFTFFSSYRADSTNVKAAYAIGDLFSREVQPINAAYVEGMNKIFRYMTNAREATSVRVSSVGWNASANDFQIIWSHSSGSGLAATLVEIKDHLPMMDPSDTVIVVETRMYYKPDFNVGLAPFTYRNVVVTRPRFAPKLCWQTICYPASS